MAQITPKGADGYPGGKDKYVDDILDIVKVILGNRVGWIVLTAILHTPKQLTIKPESERPDRKGGAATFPMDSAGNPDYAHASPRGLSRTGTGRDKWYAGGNDDDEHFDDPAPASWGDAKGGGSDDSIFFTPGHGGNDKSCARGSGICASQDDEILLHEMVHALRDMQGASNRVPTTWRYKDEEEFLAVTVANVYISKKKGNKLLRPDYRSVGPLPPPLNTSDGFLRDDENRSILEYYARVWQPVFGQLGDVETAFNPFRPFKTQ
jgi:hypothetical protein